MSDFKDKKLAKNVLRKIYPELENINLEEITERPDLHFIKNRIGVEITRPKDQLDGLFYADLEGRIRNREILAFNDMLLSTDSAHRTQDIHNIQNHILESINDKTTKAVGYYKENPWMQKLYLFIKILDPLRSTDICNIVSKISDQTKQMYDKIFFATPERMFIYDGWDLISILYTP